MKLDLQTSNESVNLINNGFTTKFAFGVLQLQITYISEFSTFTHLTIDLRGFRHLLYRISKYVIRTGVELH